MSGIDASRIPGRPVESSEMKKISHNKAVKGSKKSEKKSHTINGARRQKHRKNPIDPIQKPSFSTIKETKHNNFKRPNKEHSNEHHRKKRKSFMKNKKIKRK